MPEIVTIVKGKPSKPLDLPRLRETLVTVLDSRISESDRSSYCLVGTAAAMLHGVPLPAGDVDVLVKQRAQVDAFAPALSTYRLSLWNCASSRNCCGTAPTDMSQ